MSVMPENDERNETEVEDFWKQSLEKNCEPVVETTIYWMTVKVIYGTAWADRYNGAGKFFKKIPTDSVDCILCREKSEPLSSLWMVVISWLRGTDGVEDEIWEQKIGKKLTYVWRVEWYWHGIGIKTFWESDKRVRKFLINKNNQTHLTCHTISLWCVPSEWV